MLDTPLVARTTRLRRKLTDGAAVLAVNTTFLDAGLAEALGHLGFDAIVVDAEHGATGDGELQAIAMACELTDCALVLRISADVASLERYMNLGVSGIQIPRTQSARQVRDVVGAVKFAPQGERGLGGTRASKYGLFGRPTPEFMRAVNEQTVIMVQIEDARGIAALPEIVEIDEVDAVLIGTVDLSSDLGVPGEVDHPSVLSAVDEIVGIAREAGKPYGVAAATPAAATGAIEDGAGYVLTSVVGFIKSSATPFLEAVQGVNQTIGGRR